MSDRIPFFQHDLGAPELEALGAALRGAILTTGDTVAEFERRFAAMLGVAHAVGVTSCTAALHLALLAVGVRPGDEVITTPMTFVATATAVLQAGARPVFVDVEPGTGNLDAARVEAAIGPRTRALLPVHLFGQMCDMRALRAIADRHGLALVEDAAHCIEGRRDGVGVGTLSDAACFSFYATKNMTSGEGGAIVTRDRTRAEHLRLLRQQGLTSGAAERERHGYRHRDMVTMGWKYNMYNLQAALLLPQLERLGANLTRRRVLAARYAERLAGVPHVTVPPVEAGVEHAWHVFAVRVDGVPRDALVAALQEAGVGVTVHYYPPVHLMGFFRETFGHRPGSHPAAEAIAATTLSLPFYPAMPEAVVDEVAERMARCVSNLAGRAEAVVRSAARGEGT
ncbi:MAG: DegT/DnrJ/EryC1/StrS family aminotransferase [bacterium]|nr:DegT/DnrJ/EryC1/StrS family aminotransferase [bacterium]